MNWKPVAPGARFLSGGAPPRPDVEAELGRQTRQRLGRKLARVYAPVIEEGLPDQFRRLAEQVEKALKK